MSIKSFTFIIVTLLIIYFSVIVTGGIDVNKDNIENALSVNGDPGDNPPVVELKNLTIDSLPTYCVTTASKCIENGQVWENRLFAIDHVEKKLGQFNVVIRIGNIEHACNSLQITANVNGHLVCDVLKCVMPNTSYLVMFNAFNSDSFQILGGLLDKTEVSFSKDKTFSALVHLTGKNTLACFGWDNIVLYNRQDYVIGTYSAGGYHKYMICQGANYYRTYKVII